MDIKSYFTPDVIGAVYLIAVILFVVGLKQLSHPRTARNGNLLSSLGMLIGIVATLFDKDILRYDVIVAGILLGAVIGTWMAKTVQMTGMPQMVALLNGFGGLASYIVGTSEYFSRQTQLPGDLFNYATVILSIIIGMITFSGSVIAALKLQEVIDGKPILFFGQKTLNALLGIGAFVLSVLIILNIQNGELANAEKMFVGLGVLAFVLGITLVIPIGGADMPVVVSLLNSYSGIAVAMTGFVLSNSALIVVGTLVGASGIILTMIMTKAMNRSLLNVLFGGFGATVSGGGGIAPTGTIKSASPEEAGMILDTAESVIIVPGYGMAVSQAQHVVKKLTEYLQKKGKTVSFAIHPVAGRMPGHMNVLLAEAGVSYDILYDMDQINDQFSNTDVVIIIGANDVVNPAAKTNPQSPIYGMPVLNVEEARTVFMLKRSMNPGFAGIDNELFYKNNTLMVFGDAKKTVEGFLASLEELDK